MLSSDVGRLPGLGPAAGGVFTVPVICSYTDPKVTTTGGSTPPQVAAIGVVREPGKAQVVHWRMRNRAVLTLQRLLPVLLAVALLGACSGVQLAYSQLDRLMGWRLADYVSLTAAQRTWFRERLQHHLEWHCSTQLPAYAAWLEALQALTLEPESGARRIDRHLGQLESLAGELVAELAPTAAGLLLQLDADQQAELFERLEARLAEARSRLVEPHPEQRIRERAQRLENRLWRWMGTMTPEQSERIAEWSRAVDGRDSGWLDSRAILYEETRAVLADAEGDTAFGKLVNLFEEFLVPRTETHRVHQPFVRRQAVALAADLLASATPRQRDRLQDRLASLASDFDALSCGAAVQRS